MSDRLLSSLLWIGAFGAVACTLTAPGPTWDEPFYIGASDLYRRWFADLGQGSWRQPERDEYWKANSEHPPLVKLVIAVCQRTFLPYLRIIASARMVGALSFATLAVLVFRFTSRVQDREAGLMAGVSLVLMPHVFGHAHFAALDVPAALGWMATALAFWRAIESHTGASAPRRWSILCGVVFGFSLLTKANALLLPLVLWPWGLSFARRRAIVPILCMAFIGPAMLVACWPWLWSNLSERLHAYAFGVPQRALVPVYYLGQVWVERPAPWHYPWVMLVVTVPPGLLALALWGAVQTVRVKHCAAVGVLLLLLAGSTPLALSLPPGTGRYDGARLLLSSFAPLACMAGIGAANLERWLRARLTGRSAQVLVIGILGAQATGILLTHPQELAYYNLLVGGVPGAQAMGLETTYWGDSCDWRVFSWLSDPGNVPAGSAILFRPVGEYVPVLYEKDRFVREDVRIVKDMDGADFLVLIARQGMFTTEDWRRYRRERPVFARSVMGVPTCQVFRVSEERWPTAGGSH